MAAELLVSRASSSAESIGENVRALNVEIPMERIVAANCL